MLKLTIIIIILVSGFMFYVMGYNDGVEKSERELGKFWGTYYNTDSQGDYWELKAKKEGLI